MSESILKVNLTAGYTKHAVLQNFSLNLQAGERVGLIGASGAGKSTLLLALLGLLTWNGGWVRGEVLLNGANLLSMREQEARKLRGTAIALVPQSPLSALNSALSLRKHFVEAWRAHDKRPALLEQRMLELFDRVQLPTDTSFLNRKPGQISVGQAQRVTIAMALLHNPLIVIADEPTSALDAVTQVEVLTLLREISEEQNTALLYISHDLLSVLQLCERVALLDGGRVAECFNVATVEDEARHPMLRALLRTLPAPVEVLRHYAEEPKLRGTSEASLSTLPTSPEPYNLGAMVREVISK